MPTGGVNVWLPPITARLSPAAATASFAPFTTSSFTVPATWSKMPSLDLNLPPYRQSLRSNRRQILGFRLARLRLSLARVILRTCLTPNKAACLFSFSPAKAPRLRPRPVPRILRVSRRSRVSRDNTHNRRPQESCCFPALPAFSPPPHSFPWLRPKLSAPITFTPPSTKSPSPSPPGIAPILG